MNNIHWKTDLFANASVRGASTDDAGPSTMSDAVSVDGPNGYGGAGFTLDAVTSKSPTLATLVSFTGANGANPFADLTLDAAGDLIGTTIGGGAEGDGTLFEIAKTKHGYASTPTTLVSFTDADGAEPFGSLIVDSAGNLYGTTFAGGANGQGTIFEIAKTRRGYASTPTTLVSFTGADGAQPSGSLITDAAGDLFGTAFIGGAHNFGTVFEIAKTKKGYASTPTTLVSFTGADGDSPLGGLIMDAAGDLFGMTPLGGPGDAEGVVFEIIKTNSGYASTPTILASFTGSNGIQPNGSLIADTAGDLFGTTSNGGANTNGGTVFEIAKTQGGFAPQTTLVTFTGADGSFPNGSLIADSTGDLFGTTELGGANGDGTVFEIARTKGGFASEPTTLFSFNGANGANPNGSLTTDAAGNLFGTTTGGGANGDGTAFEIAHTKHGFAFVPAVTAVAPAFSAIPHSSPHVAAFAQAMAATNGRGEPAGSFNSRTTHDGHHSTLAVPRLLMA
jgi:uncharacterized repeat protein (TIGR03803 family)